MLVQFVSLTSCFKRLQGRVDFRWCGRVREKRHSFATVLGPRPHDRHDSARGLTGAHANKIDDPNAAVRLDGYTVFASAVK